MRANAILNRFADVPDDTGVAPLAYVHHWHLWQPGETVDAEIAHPHPWGKGSYPVNWDGLRERTAGMADPLCLEMEIGSAAFDLETPENDAQAVRHVGGVVARLGGVDVLYGQGWRRDVPLHTDATWYEMVGSPRRVAVPLYGRWSMNWGADRWPRLNRARELADRVGGPRLALFISPSVGGVDVNRSEWGLICTATRTVCEHYDADVVLWWDGGKGRRPYEEARPYMGTFREVFEGFEGAA